MLSYYHDQYGTVRGLIRTYLDQLKMVAGFYRVQQGIEFKKVTRLVFVCHGNICRSPFAEHLARTMNFSIPITSIGLSTTTGIKADVTATKIAASFDVDLSSHRATNISDFVPQNGDLYCVMEDRHIQKVEFSKHNNFTSQTTLLGLWAARPQALIYDPFQHSEAYFFTCFSIIKSSLTNLEKKLQS